MGTLISLVVLGGFFIYIGWRIWKKEQITLIHSYHYQKVAERDKSVYTAQIGKSVIIIGVGIMATGLINVCGNTLWGWVCFGIGFVAGIIKMCKAQKKYNGSWF